MLIHANPALEQQTRYGRYLLAGFQRHNLNAELTSDPHTSADIHVILGPYFAKQPWIGHPRTILLERAWWGDPDWVRLSWMGPAGEDTITDGHPSDRYKPVLKPWRPLGERCLLLLDYGMSEKIKEFEYRKAMTVRYHPVERPSPRTLEQELAEHDCVFGYKTTALVTTAIEGVQFFCLDPTNAAYPVSHTDPDDTAYPPDRTQWINNLSYHQYSGAEIEQGIAWEFLRRYLPE